MADQVLPPKGGWVIIKRRLPGGLPQVPLFSIHYAQPGDLFFPGEFDTWPPNAYAAGYMRADLPALYRFRHTRQKQTPAEVEKAQKMDAAGVGLEMRVTIRAPGGDVGVNPYEWVPCSDVAPFLDDVGAGVTMHEFGEGEAPDSKTEWRLFYLQQRGIPRRDAVAMLVGDMTKPGFWLEMSPEVVAFFDRESTPRRRTIRRPMRISITAG